jgi:hypothetical protein
LSDAKEDEGRAEPIFVMSRFLNTAFSTGVFTGRQHGAYKGWNHHLATVLPDVMNFVFSLAELHEEPEYEIPSDDVLQNALEMVVKAVADGHEKFAERYRALLSGNEEKPSVGWAVGGFLMSFFKDHIAD